ncbi:MAG: hypothetical protein ALMCE001_19750 [Methanocorpusculum sp. MCE]|nr:MAG: hypothetical protein ALMCE001_19750 [Methanocorpusculum sp. MCE]
MTALAGSICIHGFKKRAKHIPIKCFTNVGETVAKFFITFVICLVEIKAAESHHTYYSTYEKKVLSVKKKVVRNSHYDNGKDEQQIFHAYFMDSLSAYIYLTTVLQSNN